ncbi:MAG: ATP-binding protein [Nitrospirae bacterium]|nr:ATP-binding protein [Nitrospirota bacterium]MCL5238126.1 ATP-binding protein [Nitrospirota bacterium]
MKIKPRKTPYSLTGRLLWTIGALMAVVSTIFWYFLITYQEKELIANFVKYGMSFVDNVRKTTRYGMLTFQEILIQQTVEAVGSTEGVVQIKIFNCKGKVAHSSQKKDIGIILDSKSPACLACHPPDKSHTFTPRWSIGKSEEGFRVLNIVQPIYNEPACYTSACHVHPKNRKILGLVEANLSLALLDRAINQQSLAITIYVFVFLSVISVVLCAILWKFVSTPVSILAEGMKRVAAGDLEHKVEINTRDEMGELAKCFNSMTSDLSRAKTELIEWGHTLERKVEEKTEAIKKAQEQLIQSEKLASLGRMAAGVAHEINNPLTGVVTFGHLLLKKFPEGSEERQDIEVIIEQANRCSNIIKGLLGFSRATSAEKGGENINTLLKRSLDIMSHKADFFDVKFITRLDESLPLVKAGGLQLQQVFLNMILNAVDAMDGKGTLTISTRNIMENGLAFAEIEFADTGCGISEENMTKIFEPFFTTKPVGKGTGLGLAVSYGIIKDHGGNIIVKSEVGRGASFYIRIPIG